MRKSEVSKLLAYLHSDHDAVVTEEKINAWYDALLNTDAEEIWPVARHLFQSSPYLPKLADLLKVVKERASANDATWGEGWEQVLSAVRRFGRYQLAEALASLPARTAAAIGRMLGLREVGDVPAEDLATIRAQFRQRWECLESRTEAQLAIIAVEKRNIFALPSRVGDVIQDALALLDVKGAA